MQKGYLFDGVDLAEEYGIYVEKASGFWDLPKRKGETEYDWEDEDGVEAFTDSADIFFDARDVRLACHIRATSQGDFLKKLNAFRTVLMGSGLHTLKLPYNGSIVYNVYFRDKSSLRFITKWNGTRLIGKFYITFREPDPVIVPTFVIVTSPNGGERLQSGTNPNITWDSDGVTNVKIEYSINNGESWIEIDPETPSDGSYAWTIPYLDSANCLVKITETNGYDESDTVFTIFIAYATFLDSDGKNFITSDSKQLKVRI